MQTVYINGRFLTQQLSGVQRFANEILKEYARLPEKCHSVILAPKNCKLKELHGLEIKRIGWNVSHLWEQVDLPLFLFNRKRGILLNLANTGPLFYNRNIVTIHDLAFLINPAWFSLPFRKYYKFLIPKISRNALHLITVSKTIKGQLIENLEIEEDRISVIYNAVSSDFFRTTNEKSSSKEAYALTVGTIDPRKNLDMIIKGFQAAGVSNLKLYIIGGGSSNFSNASDESFDPDTIKFLGRVDEIALKNYYFNAKFFIYLSLYEGFGIPNIEAMKMGVPVLTSDIPVMREICGDAAIFVNPLDVNDIKQKILVLNKNDELREELIYRGLYTARKYSWVKSAKELKEVLQKRMNLDL